MNIQNYLTNAISGQEKLSTAIAWLWGFEKVSKSHARTDWKNVVANAGRSSQYDGGCRIVIRHDEIDYDGTILSRFDGIWNEYFSWHLPTSAC